MQVKTVLLESREKTGYVTVIKDGRVILNIMDNKTNQLTSGIVDITQIMELVGRATLRKETQKNGK